MTDIEEVPFFVNFKELFWNVFMHNQQLTETTGAGVRITRQSTRNWPSTNPRDTSTPTSSIQLSKEDFVDKYNKYLTNLEDENSIKKLTSKREKETHKRALEFVRNQLFKARRENWLYEPLEELIGYTPKF